MRALFISLLTVGGIGSLCGTGLKHSPEASLFRDTTVRKKVTYMSDVKPILINNCRPCHFPPDGNGEYLDEYDIVKDAIDDIIQRTKLKEEEEGFMPRKHSRLSDSTINVFIQWKRDSLIKE